MLAATGLFSTVNAFLPPFAISPIILFVGLAINKDAFGCMEARHVPAGILGLFPPLAEWIAAKWPDGQEVPAALAAIGHGALLVAIVWTSATVYIINRSFAQAALWTTIGAVLSAFGLIHQAKAGLPSDSFRLNAEGAFGTSPCAFTIGYMSLSVMCGVLTLMQRLGSGRVPPPLLDHDKETSPEEEGLEMAQVFGAAGQTADSPSRRARRSLSEPAAATKIGDLESTDESSDESSA